jgi:transposase
MGPGVCGTYIGEVDASDESMRRAVKRIAAKYDDVLFCYEAGPTGYGLHRLITSLGFDCMVVARDSEETRRSCEE